VSSYVRPSDVHAPKRHWSLVAVLFDGGPSDLENETKNQGNSSPSSLAIGRWDNEPVLAMRWNGNEASPLGNPQSRGLPTWFIIPEQHWKQILETEHYKFSGDKINFARDLLRSTKVYFLNRCPNPACREYQQLVLHTYRTNEIPTILNKLKQHELRFYHIICDHFWIPDTQDESSLTAMLKVTWDHYSLGSK
jgi:hypothetical protein